MNWTEYHIDLLTILWDEGHSAAAIADRLSTTRNAVTGKVSRLGLGKRKTLRKNTPFKLPSRALSLRAGAAGAMRPEAPQNMRRVAPLQPLLLKITDLELRSCRWPIGDQDFKFCGRQAEFGHSYCPLHERVAYKREAA